MNIQITRPETEALIAKRLQTGRFRSAEDVVLQALQSSEPSEPPGRKPRGKDLVELFAPVRGLRLDLTRRPSPGRPIDL